MKPDQKPNFIVFITDQHRADHIGCYGNPIVRTPAIDRLAERGWQFDEFHVATPICMPNRASIMTGRLPSRHGVRHNGIELTHDERTLPQHLQDAGYFTAHVGKSHLQNIETKPAQVPREGEVRKTPSARREGPGEHGQEVWKRWEDQPDWELGTPYYGFDTVDLCIHHADDEYGHWRRWIRTQHADADSLIGPNNATPAPEYELTRCNQAWRTKVPEQLYPTAWIADRAIDRLREAAAGDKPFFMHCSFPDPHHPYTPPGRYWSMYSPDEVPAPDSFHASHGKLPPHVQWLHDRRADGTAVKNTQALFACTEREAREAIALNYGSITFIDDSIARVLAELERLGMAGNTVVIFTADHGDYMGDHQLLLKGPVHYRGLVRIPFIWHDPMRPSQGVSDALTQSIDIAPTILDRAGIVEWNGIQGRSMLPLMSEDDSTRSAARRTDLLIEEEGQRFYMGFAGRIRMRTLRDARYRLSVYDGVSWGELYDLQADPLETHNLWDEPASAAVRASLTERLARAMIDMAETSPYPERIA